MPAHAFDTLKAAETLTAAGIDTAHAKAITGAVAAKADIAALRTELKAEIAAVKWVLGFIAAMVLLLVGRNFGAF